VTYDSALIGIAGNAYLRTVVVNRTCQNLLRLIVCESSDPGLIFSDTGIVEKNRFHVTVSDVTSKSPVASAMRSADEYGTYIAGL
jgi:hypothetical protein